MIPRYRILEQRTLEELVEFARFLDKMVRADET